MTSTSTPAQVVQAYFDTEDEDLDDCEVDITDESEDGDTAMVEFDIVECADDANNTEGGELSLVKEDGDWKIDLANSAGMGGMGGDDSGSGSSESP